MSKIKTIDELEFKYFTKEQLLEYKSSIEDRIKEIENGLEIEERPLRYFASCDVMYGDADGYSQFTEEIDRESYIKLKLFGFLDITFSHERLGNIGSVINEFISLKESYYNLEKGSPIRRYYSEVDQCLKYIDNHIIQYYDEGLDLEKLYLLYNQEENFDIKSYRIDYTNSIYYRKFIDTFIGINYYHKTSHFQVIETNNYFAEVLKTILNIKLNKKYLFLNCLKLRSNKILKVYETDKKEVNVITAACQDYFPTLDFIGEFDLTEYYK